LGVGIGVGDAAVHHEDQRLRAAMKRDPKRDFLDRRAKVGSFLTDAAPQRRKKGQPRMKIWIGLFHGDPTNWEKKQPLIKK